MRLRVKDFTTKVGSGITPKGGAESYLSCGIPLFRSQNITNNGLQMADIAFISRETHQLMSGTQLKPNDVLLNITGASIGRCFYLPKDFKEGNVNQHVCILRPTKKIQTQFLHYLLISESGQTKIDLTQTGANREGLSKEDICSFSFDIPSFSEQNRIVAYLDEKTAAIDKQVSLLEQKKEKYTLLRKSIIKKAVTEGLKGETRDWNLGRLKEQIKTLESGKRPSNDKEEVLSIGGEHIQNGHFYLEHEMYVSEQTYSNSFGKIALGDILVVKDGATIGKCMYVDTMPHEKMLINEHVYRIVASKYYYYYIVSPMGQYWFRSRNMSSAQESIKQNTILNLPVPVPPLPEQRAIADYLDEKCAKIDAIVANINQQIEKYKLLRRALINEVVTGQKII